MKDLRGQIDFILKSKLVDLIFKDQPLDKCPFCEWKTLGKWKVFKTTRTHQAQSLMTHLAYNHKGMYKTKTDLIMELL